MHDLRRAELEQLWREEYESVRGAAAKHLGDAWADDVAQQTFERLGTTSGSLRRLLPLVLTGLIIDTYRSAAYQTTPLPPEDERLVAKGFLSHQMASFPAEFDRAVRALPEPERDAFILTDLRGLSDRDAAAVLGLSRMTTHRRRARALALIREEIV